MNDQYLLDELEEKILDTVSKYVATVPRPFGLMLSGGFDSGLLAALTKPERVYTVKFPYGSKYDESRYAEAIEKHLKLIVYSLIVKKEDFEKYFPEAVKVMGEVITHFSLVPLYILFKDISEQGVKHILSGEGPDEYLGGYARQIIFDELKKLYEIPELRNYHGMIDKIISPGLIQKYGELMGYKHEDFGRYFLSDYPLQGTLGKMDMELGVIEKMEQKLAKHFGITLHYPYINEEFAEYCYRLPDNLKIRNGVTKWGFRQICMKYLPEIMRYRTKMGGPVFPVNQIMGWMDYGEFDKTIYIQKQKEILGL